MGIKFYCGINEKTWNRHPVSPGKYACVSPVMGSIEGGTRANPVFVPDEVEVMQDSGAFCDSVGYRLSFSDALSRQIEHAEKFGYANKITHRASYDLLIDEKWIDGNRVKSRWSEDDAWMAVKETVDSAYYLSKNRKGLSLVLSAQGVTVEQYMYCAEKIVPFMQDNDIFGLGGWCIIGIKKNSLRESFRGIMLEVIPYLAENLVSKVHIWGSLYAPAIGELLWLCNKYNIELSTDSAGAQKRPVMGTWGYADWKDKNYRRPSTSVRGQERARHVRAVRSWLDNFESTKYYKAPSGEKWRV